MSAGVHRDAKKVLEPWRWSYGQLWPTIHGWVPDQTQVLWKNSKCSSSLNHPRNPLDPFSYLEWLAKLKEALLLSGQCSASLPPSIRSGRTGTSWFNFLIYKANHRSSAITHVKENNKGLLRILDPDIFTTYQLITVSSKYWAPAGYLVLNRGLPERCAPSPCSRTWLPCWGINNLEFESS